MEDFDSSWQLRIWELSSKSDLFELCGSYDVIWSRSFEQVSNAFQIVHIGIISHILH